MTLPTWSSKSRPLKPIDDWIFDSAAIAAAPSVFGGVFVSAVPPFNSPAVAGNLPPSAALMGNTVIWRPASTAAYSAHFLMQLYEAAGLPPGVLSIVTGDAGRAEIQFADGSVARLAPFGAFVTIEEGIDGLIPISRLGDGRRLKHAQEALKLGQKLRVTIEKIDADQRRISLAPAEAAVGEELPSSYQERSTGGLGTLGDLLRGAPTKKRKR